ncbi:MAG TPA: type II CAAX endopeptidase family protein [Thermoanaerobaculia bacterium]|nr:type II CAAX endopeptidase family protein [Thermoanaerobaculia bacterium]
MFPLTIAIFLSLALTGALIWANERRGLLATDRFISPGARWGAYAWAGFFTLVMSALVVQASIASGSVDLARVSFWSLFTLHLLLLVFLTGWWLLVGRPPLTWFLNLGSHDFAKHAAIGVAVGIGGWMITIAIALLAGVIANAAGLLPDDVQPSPVIPWMAALPFWKKALIVFSAMTVEEAFFRGWLQKRVGLILSTILFAISHAGYGQPFLLVGVTVVSLVIGYTFYRTRNLWPCIIAHGIFDAIQLFVIVPLVLQVSGQG